MKAYALNIEVLLREPLAIEDASDDAPPVVGYRILLWIRAGSVAEAETTAAEAIKDGAIDWSSSKTREMPRSEEREQLRGFPTSTRGLVRRTGRKFFP